MNMLKAIGPADTLPTLIDRATAALDGARTSAEVLEARDLARVAYDAAQSAGRMAKAHALAIRARAEMRLAEEYDAAQDRGEVATRQHNPGSAGHVGGHNMPPATAADLGLRRDEIHEARKLRDAERAEPGLIQRAVEAMVQRGEEPTRAALKREVLNRPEPRKVMNEKAMWVWGRICDFDRQGILAQSPAFLASEMTDPMRADVRRLMPRLRDFLTEMERNL
jgi:hypothetical protein